MSAILSACGTYRYTLTREWKAGDLYGCSGSGKRLTVVMLNPSTADSERNDPTIRRVIDFAWSGLFGSILVVNLFAMRATDPHDLEDAADPVGPDNDQHLRAALTAAVEADLPVLAAWGAHAGKKWLAIDRADKVLAMVPGVRWVCLGTTKHGSPRHPLYVRASQSMVPFPTPSEEVRP